MRTDSSFATTHPRRLNSVPVYPGFKTQWNYLETRLCVRDSDNGKFAEEGLVSHSELSETRAKWT
jgi:hypothetical protein